MIKISFLIILSQASWSQSSDALAALNLFQRVQQKYSNQQHLHFSVQYKYALESNPEIVVDSLSGTAFISGNRYHMTIDSTETIFTGKKIILVYNDEKTIYVSNAGEQQNTSVLPAVFADTAYLRKSGLEVNVVENKQSQQIILSFPANMKYKAIVIDIDRKTGFVNKCRYTIKRDLMMTPSRSDTQASAKMDYAIVTASFTDYTNDGHMDKSVTEDAFFSVEGNEFVLREKYSAFTIYGQAINNIN